MRSIIFYPGLIIKLILCNFYKLKINRLTKKGDTEGRSKYIHKVTTTWAKSVMNLAGA